MQSLSEVDTTSKRASRAAGFSWGISEEIGKAIRSLELFGLPGVVNLNLYLKKVKKKHPKKIYKIDKENKNNELCPIYCGVAFLDQCKELEVLKNIKFYNVDYPLLILPFLSKASEIIGKKILIQYNSMSILTNFNKSILLKVISSNLAGYEETQYINITLLCHFLIIFNALLISLIFANPVESIIGFFNLAISFTRL